MVTMEHYQEVMGAGLNGIIFNGIEWPLTRVSRSLTVYIQVEYLKNGVFQEQSYYKTVIGNHAQSIEWHHFQW